MDFGPKKPSGMNIQSRKLAQPGIKSSNLQADFAGAILKLAIAMGTSDTGCHPCGTPFIALDRKLKTNSACLLN